jgi:hypothetical protein
MVPNFKVLTYQDARRAAGWKMPNLVPFHVHNKSHDNLAVLHCRVGAPRSMLGSFKRDNGFYRVRKSILNATRSAFRKDVCKPIVDRQHPAKGY